MRQAIEEGFILDVLKNYTPYSLAFKLAHDGADFGLLLGVEALRRGGRGGQHRQLRSRAILLC